MEIGLSHYLTVGAILFTLGILGIFLNRKNVIIILMSIELILLAVNLNFVAFSQHLGDLTGQVFALKCSFNYKYNVNVKDYIMRFINWEALSILSVISYSFFR